MILTLQQAIHNPLSCEEWQLKNWLMTLNEYIKKDTDVNVQHLCLTGRYYCPVCGELMALGSENYCDKCGQKISFKNN